MVACSVRVNWIGTGVLYADYLSLDISLADDCGSFFSLSCQSTWKSGPTVSEKDQVVVNVDSY